MECAHKLIAEADRLAWLRLWTRAEPLYAKADATIETTDLTPDQAMRRLLRLLGPDAGTAHQTVPAR